MKQNIIFSLICLTLIFPLYSQEMDNDDIMPNEIYLQIEQIIYNSSEQYTFLYTNSTIRIYKKTISKIGFSKKKIVYYKKIKDVEKVMNIEMKFEKLSELKSEYIKSQLGGIRWEITYIIGNKNRKVIVENTTVDVISEIFDAINLIIPFSKPKLVIWGHVP